jgi:aspartate/methionine/tyrosine aminotransferase
MPNILLAKSILPPDFIDLSVGESHLVKDALDEVFNLLPYKICNDKSIFEYSDPKGYTHLVKLLENKYNKNVVICAGAKQGLCAAFYALKQMGKKNIGLRTPYWCLLPSAITMHGLEVSLTNNYDSYLCVAPGNPDNYLPNIDELRLLSNTCKNNNIPFIHDCAYFTPTYLTPNYPAELIGDVQIFSFSKMFGLSGLRCGFILCDDDEMFHHMTYYIETMTVGVSTFSQLFIYHILYEMSKMPNLEKRFYNKSFEALKKNKLLLKNINNYDVEVPSNMENLCGMFAFLKVYDKDIFRKAKVNVIDGSLFGAPGFVRLNLAVPYKTLEESINRINNL